MDVREALLQAAVKIFAEAGTRGATTRRIAEEAGVNEVTLFRHFGSKDTLMREALDWFASRASRVHLPEIPIDPEAELVAWARTHHQNLYRARALIRTSMGEYEEHPEMSSSACRAPVQLANHLHGYLLALRERGLATDDWDARAAVSMLMGALFADAMGRDIMPERYPYALRDAAARYVHLFLRAIGAPLSARVSSRTGTPA